MKLDMNYNNIEYKIEKIYNSIIYANKQNDNY